MKFENKIMENVEVVPFDDVGDNYIKQPPLQPATMVSLVANFQDFIFTGKITYKVSCNNLVGSAGR